MNFEIEKNENFNDNDFLNWKKRWQERLRKIVMLLRNILN